LNKKIEVLKGKKDRNYLLAFEKDGLIKNGKLTNLGEELLKIWENKKFKDYYWQLELLKNLVNSIYFIPIEKKEEKEFKGFVYDLSTETKNFVANGIIVHNTTLLDKIRKTAIADKEYGRITQHIGATEVPAHVIKKNAGDLLKIFKVDLKIPGILFIDTPGHEAFSNLRKRGGSIADFAIVVVDVNELMKPQTKEAIEILKQTKTPFIIALNKIDTIQGWKSHERLFDSLNPEKQDPKALEYLETQLYKLVEQLYELGFESERFDRVEDFTRQVAIVPVSAKTGEGLPELLVLIIGLVQKYLGKRIEINENQPAKGVILEIKEVKGLGKTLDVIIYDGTLKKNDEILFLTKDGKVKKTKIRALLKIKPLQEIRDEKAKFQPVNEVVAASGVKISAPDLEDALPGSPLVSAKLENAEEFVKQEAKLNFELDKEGIIVKADTLGVLEALVNMLKNKEIPIKKADIGKVTLNDLREAEVNEKDEYKIIAAFNVEVPEEIIERKPEKVYIIKENIIYSLVDKVEEKIKEIKKEKEKELLQKLTPPGKFKILEGFVFRVSNPAIVGIEVLAGKIRPNIPIMRKDGKVVGTLKGIQKNKENVSLAEKGEQVAVAIDGVMIGRQLKEGDIIYTAVNEEEFRIYKKLKEYLTKDEIEVLKEIAEIKRKENPMWGV
ncbi:MAG: translation initiation factor IF-2, partial [Nanoarchaeota archaeon]